MWKYIKTTLIPAMYNTAAGERDGVKFTPDQNFMVVGLGRLRQLRVRQGKFIAISV